MTHFYLHCGNPTDGCKKELAGKQIKDEVDCECDNCAALVVKLVG